MPTQLEDQLVSLQTRVKKLAANRDQLIRDQGVAERRCEEAAEKLRELGLDVAGLSSKELQNKAEELEAQLAEKVKEITAQVEAGEALLTRYQQISS